MLDQVRTLMMLEMTLSTLYLMLSSTLDSSVGCEMENEMLRFGSLDEVINFDDLESFAQGMAWLEKDKRALK